MEMEVKKAGRIASKIRKDLNRIVKPGKRLIEIAEEIEKRIEEMEAIPAFPVNLSVGHIAAHFTPVSQDNPVLGENDIIKVDFGACVNGFLSDTAITFDFSGEYGKLIEACELALENAISIIKEGVSPREIGAEIEKTIKRFGFKPIENLNGHSLGRWTLHSGLSIPNVEREGGRKLREGDVIAIEPFATDGAGWVIGENRTYIFSLKKKMLVRAKIQREIISFAMKRKNLPFSVRWIENFGPWNLLMNNLNDMVKRGILEAYPVLRDKNFGIVGQAEHTVLVEKDSCLILTGD